MVTVLYASCVMLLKQLRIFVAALLERRRFRAASVQCHHAIFGSKAQLMYAQRFFLPIMLIMFEEELI